MIQRQRTTGLPGRGLVTAAVIAALTLAPAAVADVPDPAAGALPQLARQDFPEPVLTSLRTALGAYEAARSDLAGDRLQVLPASASALAGALRLTLEDQAGLAAGVPEVIEEAARAAESLAAAADLPAARVNFGEVSRQLMLLAEGDPRLAEGWHAFACPMVESFAKWIQPTEDLENPYMGPAMPKCGLATDWSVPAPKTAGAALASVRKDAAPAAREASRPEPVFKPGIPGLKMVDVRDHKFLWREIDTLQVWERGERITVREYRSKAIEKTVHFLELDGTAADEFVEVAAEMVDQVRESFKTRRFSGASGGEDLFSADVQAATTRLTSLLQEAPRHQLFAPGCKKWLLKLAFGPREAKEAREAKGSGQA